MLLLNINIINKNELQIELLKYLKILTKYTYKISTKFAWLQDFKENIFMNKIICTLNNFHSQNDHREPVSRPRCIHQHPQIELDQTKSLQFEANCIYLLTNRIFVTDN